jgi:hypothetical protein
MFTPPNWGDHAAEAKERHGITEEAIADAWVYGELEPTRDGCWRLIGKEITLVLSKNGMFIITLYPNKYSDQYKAEKASNAMSTGVTRWED